MVNLIECEPGARIELAIAARILRDERQRSLGGLAVAVERTNPKAAGIAKTAQAVRTPLLETNLRHVRPRAIGRGVIFAIDPEHNALWLRPQRLTTTAIDSGFLVVAGFVQDELPAYIVTVREPGWRDGEPSEGISQPRFLGSYADGGLPDLLDRHWEQLGTVVSETPRKI